MYVRPPSEPLGPDSLTWRYFGDWRGLLCALWAGSMQNMHPQLGAGVEEHSRFFDERWERLFRSLYPIGGVVYDAPRAQETARTVRGYHDTIKGVDRSGRPYHALDPETFYWAHATFFMNTLLTAEHFAGGVDEADRRRLYDEHVQWYALYGMSMRPVPASWEDFQVYWKRMCTHVLEDNAAARGVLEVGAITRPTSLRWLPDSVWTMVRRPLMCTFIWLTTGLYDPEVRDLLGLRWTRPDALALRVLGRTIATAFALVPFDYRYHPRARAGWRRSRGTVAADAPLVETPARNLPPPDQRDDPTHYVPTELRSAAPRRTG